MSRCLPKRLTILLFMMYAWSSHACAANPEYIQAKIYFLGWNSITERTFHPDWTRAHYEALFTFASPSYVENFVQWLKIPELKGPKESVSDSSRLPWLVIDLYSADKKTTTYYSDGCYLFSEDGRYSRPVSDEFRKKFTVYEEPTPISSQTNNLAFKCD
jgi:hypothetical protein